VVSTLESRLAIQTGTTPEKLSEQQLLDCSFETLGCGGADI
jgi:hypothetical protein